ncbi:MAG: cyanophycinase [Gammaproteobacteria bacterium]|nr:MAG: cyanophycinase [Gammaproteobacteria bacterium]
MSPSPGTDGVARGYVIPIGGAEEKLSNPTILEKFIKLCGGSDSRIIVIPTASRLEDTGSRYVDLFHQLGAGEVVSIAIETRKDSKREDYLKELESADGVFITGGNQLRLSTILGGTPVAQAIRYLNAHGTHIAGTSAGAAIIPEHMIVGGGGGSTPTEDGVTLAPGLGLTNSFIIDQHFRQRDRLGRLLSALSYNPFVTGIGLDEDTAAFIDAEGIFEVVGSGAITVVDPGRLEYSSMGHVKSGDPVTLIGLQMHILAEGSRFDSRTRIAST